MAAWRSRKGAFVAPVEQHNAARAARLSARDAEYRAALRVGDGPLPRRIGNVSHASAGGQIVTSGGGRKRGRATA